MKNQYPVLWFLGLSGAGKTTLATMLSDFLKARDVAVHSLDGDNIRARTGNKDFSREKRIAHLTEVGNMARQLSDSGMVIASFITPYEDVRLALRSICPGYIEIWVDSPIEECEARDVKGLYKKARSGEIKLFTGISDTFDPATNCQIRLKTQGKTPQESFDELLNELKRRKII